MSAPEIDRMMQLLARLPGLGPRSARRAALHLMQRRDALLRPLAEALAQAAEKVATCSVCGNLDAQDPCAICRDVKREAFSLCVVEDVGDLWALERTGAFTGKYHVLGGTLSAMDGITPEDLGLDRLVDRVRRDSITEVIIALNATVEGQTTAHFIADQLTGSGARITRLAHGVPVGGDLDYLDDGTLTAALRARRDV
jgi:recombination protein RecR